VLLKAHLFRFIYMRVELWANHIWDNIEVLLGAILGELENVMGTHREHDGN
jgi:hypothetical protein